MELLFVVIGAAGLGAIPRYLLADRDRYGSALLPSVSVAVASIVWAGLTWLDWPFDGGLIWWASLIAGTVAAFVVALLIPRKRKVRDTELFETLSHS